MRDETRWTPYGEEVVMIPTPKESRSILRHTGSDNVTITPQELESLGFGDVIFTLTYAPNRRDLILGWQVDFEDNILRSGDILRVIMTDDEDDEEEEEDEISLTLAMTNYVRTVSRLGMLG